MTYGIKAKVTETKNGFGIEFVTTFGEHHGWFKKSNGEVKEWRLRKQADKVLESSAVKYGWLKA